MRRLSTLTLLPLLLGGAATAAAAGPATLWEAIQGNSSFTVLAGCVRLADDPSLMALLDDASAACTLFAPLDSAFNRTGDPPPCQDGNATEAAALVRYLTSSQATPLPYLNQPFPTLLDGGADADAAAATAKCVYAYSISKDAATPAELPPILYINQARALGWEAVGGGGGGGGAAAATLYLVPLDAALARPPGSNGSIWDVLEARADLSTAAGLIREGLPDLQQQLVALPDVVARNGYRTLFVPDNEAWAALPADRLARLQSDPQALRTLLAFHTLSNAQGDYPRSTTGMYYSQQLFPAASPRAGDVYRQFYSALRNGFEGLRLPNDLGILLDIARANASSSDSTNSTWAGGTLQLAGGAASVTAPDVGAYNGVVHVIDVVLPLPEPIPGVLAAPPQPLAASGNFTVLAQLIEAAGPEVAGRLATGGPYTLLAPTDAAFAAAIAADLLPPLPALLRDAARCASLVQYWAVNSSASGLLLFKPDPYHDPFQDDFPDGLRLYDASDDGGGGEGRPLFVHRQRVQPVQGADGAMAPNATAVFINGARLYQCAEGDGWGPVCAATRQPSNTYAINDDRIVNMVHALDAVPFPPAGSLLELVQADPDLSTFAALLARAAAAGADGGLSAVLAGTAGTSNASAVHTLFAPTNDALAALLAERPWLVVGTAADGGPMVHVELLRYHLVPDQLWYARWLLGATDAPPRLATAAFGGEALLAIAANGSTAAGAPAPSLEVNRLPTAATDAGARNGVLHRLRGVLVPDLLQIAYAAGDLGHTVAALEAVGGSALLDMLKGPGPLTLLAPMDAAWAEGEADEATPALLRYHLGATAIWPENVTAAGGGALSPLAVPSLAGWPLYLTHLPLAAQHPYAQAPEGGLFANQAALRLPARRALNGVVYALDAVLAPPQAFLLELLAADPEGGQAFAGLLERAGLAAALNGSSGGRAAAGVAADGEEQWTVFAPVSSVLDGIYRGEEIWADAQQLPRLLGFHLVPGRRLFTPAFADAPCAASAEGFCTGPPDLLVSLQGQALATQVVSRNETFISAADGAFTARVVRANVHARNGVLHWVEGICTYDGFRRPS